MADESQDIRRTDVSVAELRVQFSSLMQQVAALVSTTVSRNEVELMNKTADLEHAAIRTEIASIVKQSGIEHDAIRRELVSTVAAVDHLATATRQTIAEEHREGERAHEQITKAVEKLASTMEASNRRVLSLVWGLLITAFAGSLGVIGALIYEVGHRVTP
jgi:hypothetical protein